MCRSQQQRAQRQYSCRPVIWQHLHLWMMTLPQSHHQLRTPLQKRKKIYMHLPHHQLTASLVLWTRGIRCGSFPLHMLGHIRLVLQPRDSFHCRQILDNCPLLPSRWSSRVAIQACVCDLQGAPEECKKAAVSPQPCNWLASTALHTCSWVQAACTRWLGQPRAPKAVTITVQQAAAAPRPDLAAILDTAWHYQLLT